MRNTFKVVLMGILIAIEVVLSRFLGFYVTPTVKINFSFLAIAAAGIMFGPVGGGLCGGVGDFLGALLFPVGAYHPGFTLTAVLSGVVFGLLLSGRRGGRWYASLSAALIVAVLCTLLLDTLWLMGLYKSGFIALLPGRLIKAVVMVPLQTLLNIGLRKLLEKTNVLPKIKG